MTGVRPDDSSGSASTPDPVAPNGAAAAEQASVVTPAPEDAGASGSPSPVGAAFVALGILLSRLFGLVRTRVVASSFGVESVAADAFAAALRIPNFLQNLFGEGVLSASFIPVYSGLLGEGKSREADRLAGAVFAILALLTALLVLAGILAAPFLVDVIAGGGFTGERRELTIRLVRIIFPGTGLLVISAWCLGILNSHRRFFLPYAAPVVWNSAIIAALILGASRTDMNGLAVWAAWGVLAGSVLQLVVQLPTVLSIARQLSLRVSRKSAALRQVVRNFLPATLSRGVAQVSAYIDVMIAGNLPLGAVAALTYAQTIYLLPVSLFGMSISAAELPEMSRESRLDADGGSAPDAAAAAALRERLASGLRRVAFFVVPSAAALLLLGDVVAGALLQTGSFGREDSLLLWAVLAGSSVGLLATTMARLHVSAFYALRDARTPLRVALVRITVAVSLGLTFAFLGPRLLGVDPRWGVAGLTLASGLAGWLELAALRHLLAHVTGSIPFGVRQVAVLWACALAAGAAAWAVKLLVGVDTLHPVLFAAFVLGTFAAVYGVTTLAAGVAEARALAARAGIGRR